MYAELSCNAKTCSLSEDCRQRFAKTSVTARQFPCSSSTIFSNFSSPRRFCRFPIDTLRLETTHSPIAFAESPILIDRKRLPFSTLLHEPVVRERVYGGHYVMFADRTNWNLEENRLTRALAQRRAAGCAILDLSASNPTTCGFA